MAQGKSTARERYFVEAKRDAWGITAYEVRERVSILEADYEWRLKDRGSRLVLVTPDGREAYHEAGMRNLACEVVS